jgi:hypothetical protein
VVLNLRSMAVEPAIEARIAASPILECQAKLVPAEGKTDIIARAESFAQADAGKWVAARAMADDSACNAALWSEQVATESEPEPEDEQRQDLQSEQYESDSGLGYDDAWPLVEKATSRPRSPSPRWSPSPSPSGRSSRFTGPTASRSRGCTRYTRTSSSTMT